MARTHKIMALIAGGALALAGTGYAATQASSPAPAAKTAKAANKAMTSVTRGKIKSISDNQIVIERKMKAGTKDFTYAMTPNTQKQSDLKAGDRVVVHYRKDNNKEVATAVRPAKPGKSGKAAK
jgi:hypothetical protein